VVEPARFYRRKPNSDYVKIGSWRTTEALDEAVIAQFEERLKGAEPRDTNKTVTVYKLTQDYSLFVLNCTAICLNASEGAQDRYAR
jgi:hypothetical protein